MAKRTKTRKEVGGDVYEDEDGNIQMARQTKCPNAYDDPEFVKEFGAALMEMIAARYPKAEIEEACTPSRFFVTLSKHVVFLVTVEGLAG